MSKSRPAEPDIAPSVSKEASKRDPVCTPDSRYLVMEGALGPRLWRASNPNLDPGDRAVLVQRLMSARRLILAARGDPSALAAARAEVDEAKRALGERGPAWWTDGAPDLNRTLVRNSPYQAWWEQLSGPG